MSQHDFNIANQGFPATRADINNAFQAIASNSSGPTAPSTTYANQWWYDTTNNKMYLRNAADSAWIEVAVIDQTNNEWKITSGVIQAVDGDGLVFKTDDGNTRIEIQDDGDVAFDTDTLFVDAANDRVGIGTSSPPTLLSLEEETSNTTTRSDMLRLTATSSGTTGVGFGANIQFVGERTNGTLQGMGRIGFGASTNTSSNLSSDFIIAPGVSGAPTEKVRVLAEGGITFNGDTAAANALDDYEEGTWTPVATYGTISYQQANYTKIGRQVIVSAFIYNISDQSTAALFTIGGLPFTSASNTRTVGGIMLRHSNNTSITAPYVSTYSTAVEFYSVTSGTWDALQYNDFNSSAAEMYFTVSYIV